MTSFKHMSWMEILSTGVCIAIIIADIPCNSMIHSNMTLYFLQLLFLMILVYVVTYIHIVTSDSHDIGHKNIHIVQQ